MSHNPREAKASIGEGPRDPEQLVAAGADTPSELPAETRPGKVELTVSDLPRSIAYYEESVGLRVLSQDRGTATLGSGMRALLTLIEETGARPARGHTGLYHFALLVPERVDLARWLAHSARDKVPLTGLSDHFVSEALYLSDPDEHGIEIYWDRPRPMWEGKVASQMTTLPLDVNDLMREVADDSEVSFAGLPDETVMGHVHLKVAFIQETVAFYRDLLGFGLMAELGSQAAFLGAGGYHHHLGANTWESAGASPPPPGSAALRQATIELPDARARDSVLSRLSEGGVQYIDSETEPVIADPSGNRIALVIAADPG